MYHAGAIPKQHVSARCPIDVCAQVFIGGKNYGLIGWKTLNDNFRIAACANHITQRFNPRTAIDVAHDDMVGMFVFKFFE